MARKSQNRITAFLNDLVNRALGVTASRGIELWGLTMMTVSLAAFLALISYDAMDPSWNRVTDAAPQNWLGHSGAIFSDQAHQFFGIGAWAALPAIAAYGWRCVRHDRLTFAYLRLLAWFGGITGTAMGAAFLFPMHAPTPQQSADLIVAPISGGLLGQLLHQAVTVTASDFGVNLSAYAISSGILLTGLGLTLALVAAGWLKISLRLTGTGLVKAYAALAALRPRIAGFMSRQPEAQTLKETLKQGLIRRLAGWPQKLSSGLVRVLSRISAAVATQDKGAPQVSSAHAADGRQKENDETLTSAPAPASKPRQRESATTPAADIPVEMPSKKPRPGKRATREDQHAMTFDGSDSFDLPPLRLLTENRQRNSKKISEDALQSNARLLEGVLQDFGVKGKILKVRPGPVVTLYELEPAAGIRASRVVGLADDIARSMSAIACRVATVPGQNVIGIELPNQDRETVYLRELLSSAEFEKNSGGLPMALGKDIGGGPVLSDLARMPHLLVAGTTGSGKSVGVNAMILSILYRMTPAECRLILVDPKMLELSVYDGIPHLLAPVVTEPKKAVVALKWAVQEMENRYRKMSKIGVRNIHGYNERMAQAIANKETLTRKVQVGIDSETGEAQHETETIRPEKLPFIVIVIDEMADLMLVAGKEIEGAIQRLAQMARAAGVHLITATQRPSVDVITGTIKANFPSRISFQVTSKIDSRTVLGEQGGEQLLGMGDMLFMAGGGRLQRVHGPFVSDAEVEKVVKFLKKQGLPDYVEAVTTEPEETPDMGGEAGGESLYDQAVAIVTRDNRASTSYVQRRLSIGYNRAASLIEKMEEEGVISAPNHAGKREVLAGKH